LFVVFVFSFESQLLLFIFFGFDGSQLNLIIQI